MDLSIKITLDDNALYSPADLGQMVSEIAKQIAVILPIQTGSDPVPEKQPPFYSGIVMGKRVDIRIGESESKPHRFHLQVKSPRPQG